MAGQAGRALAEAAIVLAEGGEDVRRNVLEHHDAVDAGARELDELAMRLLAMAPLASELRLVTVAMKISHNLERIADQANTVARRAMELNRQTPVNVGELERMAAGAGEMLRDSMGAFVARDAALAFEVIHRDHKVDRINREVHRTLAEQMITEPPAITRCLHLMAVAKALERAADHATNIAETVVYLCHARDIRHAESRLEHEIDDFAR